LLSFGCIAVTATDSGLLLHTEWRGQSVCVSVGHFMSPAKTSELIEMLFGVLTWVCPRNRVLDKTVFFENKQQNT